jgi:hypothetical protein
MELSLLWANVDMLEEQAIRRFEHYLVIRVLFPLGILGPVARRFEEPRNVSFFQIRDHLVHIRL